MVRFKNPCSVLTRLLRRKPTAVCTTPPPPPAPQPRCYYTFRRVLRDWPPAFRPPPTQAPARRYGQYNAGPWRQLAVRSTHSRGRSCQLAERGAIVLAAVLATGCVAVTVSYGTLEAVPFTGRTQFIILTTSYERELGECRFAKLKEELASRVLPPDDPASVRVRRITSEIVRAVHRGLASRQRQRSSSDDGEDTTCGYGSTTADLTIVKNREAEAHQDDESQDPAMAKISNLLDSWEVIVVRANRVNAMCLPGGKIVVFTGLLDMFKEDAEIATVLGHEVGHAIARHGAEKVTSKLWILIVQIVIWILSDMRAKDLDVLSKYFLTLPFSRRMEMEADHVGLMLLAAAGYDPRVAPGVYEKLVTKDSVSHKYSSTHPSCKKRSQNLSQERVMNKALKLYREFSTGQGSEERLPMDSGT